MANRITRACLVLGMLLLPAAASAQVIISEIAWMGTDAPTNAHYCEWVELFNPGTETVSLSGWKLATADGGMNASLTGSIDPGEYLLVERYTANACPDPVASIDGISVPFGSGLANSGETLLLRSSSAEIDRVDAAAGWEESVGGDATHKYTAQRAGEAWVTAAPTPGAANATESVAPEEESSSSSSSSSSSKKVANPVPYLIVEPGTDRTLSTGAHATYRALVYDSKSTVRHHARISWAFGDGGREIGREVSYKHDEPGEYLVVARAEDGQSTGYASFTVFADPARVLVTGVSERGIELTNENDRVVDLSRWVLAAGEGTYRLPEDTWMRPGGRVLFLSSVTGLVSTTSAALLYPDGKQAHALAQPEAPVPGSLPMKEVESLSVPSAPIPHEARIEAPPAAADPAAGGAVSAFWGLLRGLFPEAQALLAFGR